MIKGKPFDPATETSRRPTPEKFAHLRKWIDIDKKFLDITSISDLQDIDVMLEQMGTLYLSNEISQVIAQLIGKYNDGFVTIEGTADGELKVQIAGGAAVIGSLAAGTEAIGSVSLLAGTAEIGSIGTGSKTIGGVGLVAGTAEIGKLAAGVASIGTVGLNAGTAEIGKLAAGVASIGTVKLSGTSQTVEKAIINKATAATHSIITAVSGEIIKITNIMFTVAGDCNITFCSAATPISGAMDFGGTGEPKGMVHSFGNHPLCLTVSEAFQITLSAAVQVSGYVTYYTE